MGEYDFINGQGFMERGKFNPIRDSKLFNKKVNKILAVNLALGLSFVGCNFRAVDTKPHGILKWVKVNLKKSVLIGLISLLGGAGSYLGYKGYQYSHVKFYDSELEAEKDLKKVKSEYQDLEFEIRKVHSTSKDTIRMVIDLLLVQNVVREI
ncbi:MAG: hypothetical protein RsTaC01_0868 [Candidatus Paraimprobicoccus trichonymphae]|uniref:Uncharacterized protein n=1 Tax=Candidatus Paraimprobicoccus trichonymphae TaxID=3033793 RepID=A0AA48HX11_9FIRM|nr:MAG: hypothetical protein RsTaC01_0868 [Candidatus Paraimprobicoccus trichonymphae]